MKFLKKLSIAAAALLMAGATIAPTTTAHAASSAVNSELVHKGQLTIGTEGTFNPYSFRKNGKLTGFEIDLGKAVAKKMGLKAKIVPTKWDSLLAGVNSGKFDVIMDGVTVTAKRRKHYAFSSIYLKVPFVLIQKKDGNLTSLKDIKGKKVIGPVGSNYAMIIKQFGGKLVQDDGNFGTTLSLLKQGRGEATIDDEGAWKAYTDNHQTKGLKATTIPTDQAAYEVGAAFSKKDKATRKAFNKALDQCRKDGTVSRLSKKYFGKDVSVK